MNGKTPMPRRSAVDGSISLAALISVRGFGPTPANAFERAALAMSAAVVDLPKVGIEKADRCEIHVNLQTNDFIASPLSASIASGGDGCGQK